MNWWQSLNGKIIFNEPLKRHTTFNIGGPAKFFIEPKDTADLELTVGLLKKNKVPFYLIGRGSNILISDKGINAAVIRLSRPGFKKINLNGSLLECGGAALLSELVLFAKDNGLSAVEFLSGIPGTVAGALIMNAGAFGKNIGDLVENVTVMDYNSRIKRLRKEEIKFGCRKSNLSGYIILCASLKLHKEDKDEISGRIKEYINIRKKGQDYRYPSAGCIFKNPARSSAGKLIDLCGLKGKRIGGASVSMKHANFIINIKKAKARDVLKLMDLMARKVKDKFNITLKPEIKIWQ